MKPSHHNHILAILLSLATLPACIREELSACLPEAEIIFTYTPATYARTGIEAGEVNSITLFIFDAKGIFHSVWTDETPNFGPNYTMGISYLPAGEYLFIAWGNLREPYITQPTTFLAGKTSLNEVQLCLDIYPGATTRGVPPLFHAAKTDNIQTGLARQLIDLPLVQAYNTINLTAEGFPATDDDFHLIITDDNGKYQFDYSFVTSGEFSYTTPCTKDGDNQLHASLNILKLAADRHPRLEIRNDTRQKTLYSVNLVALLNKINGIDYDQTHTFDIHIRFNPDDTGLHPTIFINGWQLTEENGVLR